MKKVLLKYHLSFCLLVFSFCLFAQEEKIELDPVEAEILFDYYSQDGDNSAVTGGKGTEELRNYASILALKIPVSAVGNLSIKAGVDAYTSASSGNIDLYSTGASGNDGGTAISEKDVRKHINVGYAEQFTSSEINFNAGYSTEYDVNSINAGVGYAKYLNNQNQKLSIAANAYIDRWLLIYPGEIRNPNQSYYDDDDDEDDRPRNTRDDDDGDDDDDDDYNSGENQQLSKDDFNTDIRYTFNVNFGFQSVINRKTNFALIIDYTRQSGLLTTPFHRVYFDDGEDDIEDKTVRVENLPRSKNKIAIGARLNHFLTHAIVTRLYYRYYFDDFGINAHTFSLEVPVKAGKTWTFYPFVRFYTQTENDYFRPFGAHDLNEEFYTSDYDLAAFSSFHRGLAVKISPPKGLFSIGKHFNLKEFKIRYSHYDRTTGLVADNITFATKLIF